ncbi:hypothetical protein HC026_03120 [Lactobacillus sp. LC28-10]|uniref:SMI1/KNR4 family protein n=1 Tax=Secundilactobacillus angelensis TaxID=2722706 RepID=A0ABX1KXQ2_9LACO|nr:hypothetical protein [Secundilactobacillus angelensis]MCH5461615.1 hypothetical protein [Secundilactobacillus angelensis]NLR17910.1 hypothetical protein [Secundilactobacillus angelensis]
MKKALDVTRYLKEHNNDDTGISKNDLQHLSKVNNVSSEKIKLELNRQLNWFRNFSNTNPLDYGEILTTVLKTNGDQMVMKSNPKTLFDIMTPFNVEKYTDVTNPLSDQESLLTNYHGVLTTDTEIASFHLFNSSEENIPIEINLTADQYDYSIGDNTLKTEEAVTWFDQYSRWLIGFPIK